MLNEGEQLPEDTFAIEDAGGELVTRDIMFSSKVWWQSLVPISPLNFSIVPPVQKEW